MQQYVPYVRYAVIVIIFEPLNQRTVPLSSIISWDAHIHHHKGRLGTIDWIASFHTLIGKLYRYTLIAISNLIKADRVLHKKSTNEEKKIGIAIAVRIHE